MHIVEGAERIFVASGKKIIVFDPQQDSADEIIKKICGRTGNLRAPTLRVGTTFYVGFNEEMYNTLAY